MLIAGNTTGAIRRAANYGDGWLPLQIVAHFDIDWFERKSAQSRDELEPERPGFEPRLLLRIGSDFAQLVDAMTGLAPRLDAVDVQRMLQTARAVGL